MFQLYIALRNSFLDLRLAVPEANKHKPAQHDKVRCE